MAKPWRVVRNIVIVAGAIVLIYVGILALATALILYPGVTPQGVAQILVHDYKSGGRALWLAKIYGDWMLAPLQQETNNFRELNSRNSFRIMELLTSNRSEKCNDLLLSLYHREEIMARLVGAVVLAAQGKLPEDIDDSNFLVGIVKDSLTRPRTIGKTSREELDVQLAIIALGHSGSSRAIPYLKRVLERPPENGWLHIYACEAVAKIDHGFAIPILRECLRSKDCYAQPDAFKLLVALGDREAVPLAIDTLSQANTTRLIQELEDVTGQRFGGDVKRWTEWWKSVENNWQVPTRFLGKLSG